jgi:hypothetical protein
MLRHVELESQLDKRGFVTALPWPLIADVIVICQRSEARRAAAPISSSLRFSLTRVHKVLSAFRHGQRGGLRT